MRSLTIAAHRHLQKHGVIFTHDISRTRHK